MLYNGTFLHEQDLVMFVGIPPTGMTLDQWQALGAISGSAIVIITTARLMLWKPIVKVYKTHMAAMKAIPDLVTDMKVVKEQVLKNGGMSIRDAVDRIELNQIITNQVINNLLGSASVGSFHANREGLVTQVSRTLCRIMQRSEHELLGNSWISWVCEEDREDVEKEWRSVVNMGREMDMEFGVYTDAGTIIRVRIKAMQLTGNQRQLVGFFGVITKVTEE